MLLEKKKKKDMYKNPIQLLKVKFTHVKTPTFFILPTSAIPIVVFYSDDQKKRTNHGLSTTANRPRDQDSPPLLVNPAVLDLDPTNGGAIHLEDTLEDSLLDGVFRTDPLHEESAGDSEMSSKGRIFNIFYILLTFGGFYLFFNKHKYLQMSS